MAATSGSDLGGGGWVVLEPTIGSGGGGDVGKGRCGAGNNGDAGSRGGNGLQQRAGGWQRLEGVEDGAATAEEGRKIGGRWIATVAGGGEERKKEWASGLQRLQWEMAEEEQRGSSRVAAVVWQR
ncbi:hypothetical protein BHM03_00033730 [Ensete ventricosum]|nr:hypothetical protein BHM03_00033730 [Ensete ventricosum]